MNDKPIFPHDLISPTTGKPWGNAPGITLRELFAAVALHGLCSNPDVTHTLGRLETEEILVSKMSRAIADDLIKQLELHRPTEDFAVTTENNESKSKQ